MSFAGGRGGISHRRLSGFKVGGQAPSRLAAENRSWTLGVGTSPPQPPQFRTTKSGGSSARTKSCSNGPFPVEIFDRKLYLLEFSTRARGDNQRQAFRNRQGEAGPIAGQTHAPRPQAHQRADP